MRTTYLAQAGKPLEEPLKVDNSEPRNVVVVDNKSYSPLETALRTADEAGGALFTLLILGLFGFVMLGGHKKIFGVFDAVTQLINLLRETQKETTEAVRRNSLTLEQVSLNDSKITETLTSQQATIAAMVVDFPIIKGKQDDQILRLKYAIELLKFNADLLLQIAERLEVKTRGRPEFIDPPERS